jgi:hypothetical protein
VSRRRREENCYICCVDLYMPLYAVTWKGVTVGWICCTSGHTKRHQLFQFVRGLTFPPPPPRGGTGGEHQRTGLHEVSNFFHVIYFVRLGQNELHWWRQQIHRECSNKLDFMVVIPLCFRCKQIRIRTFRVTLLYIYCGLAICFIPYLDHQQDMSFKNKWNSATKIHFFSGTLQLQVIH